MEIVLARIRTIKPEFFTSPDIVDLSPLARLLYIALWCEADREGRLVWSTRTFKMRYLPADSCDIEALSEELLRAGVVVLYGDGYAYIPSFLRHQHINPRESVSVLPNPDDENDASSTRHSRVSDVQVGREGKGKERNVKEGDTCVAVPAPCRFEEFWQSWPRHGRKVAKDQCRNKWKSRDCEAVFDQIMASLASHKASDAWKKADGEFIPAPLTWLNQSRWEAPTQEQAREELSPWYEGGRKSIEAKAAEIGIGLWDEASEQWGQYRARVFRAAGHDPRLHGLSALR